MREALVGSIGTGSGSTHVSLILDGDRAELTVHTRWMGQPELELELACDHRVVGSHSGVLTVRGAKRSGVDVPLPPSDGPVLVEYVRVPPQPATLTSTVEDAAATVTDDYTLVLWLHPESYFDDGTQLAADQYDVPPEQFRPVVDAFAVIEHPRKLGPARDR